MKKNKIKYRWIAQDRNGDIWAYTNKPTLFLVNWSLDINSLGNDFLLLATGEELGFVDETPPNWQKSLRRYCGLKGILTRLKIWWIR